MELNTAANGKRKDPTAPSYLLPTTCRKGDNMQSVINRLREHKKEPQPMDLQACILSTGGGAVATCSWRSWSVGHWIGWKLQKNYEWWILFLFLRNQPLVLMCSY